MLPGGHVEEFENPAQAAVREVREETGLEVELSSGPRLAAPNEVSSMPLPLWVVEQQVPPEHPRLPQSHVHVDHLFAGWSRQPARCGRGQHEFRWYAYSELPRAEMFDGSRSFAQVVFANLDTLLPVDVPAR
jgi:8-oxo-dGTP pyrophosphatase MutT (NUDIX family)